jgi:hypothetical protein
MRWLRTLLLAATCCTVVGCAAPGATSPGAEPPAMPSAPAGSIVGSELPPMSLPADLGSQPPLPLPTPVAGSEGTLPPMPSSGARSTDTADPDGVYAAQNVIGVFAEEVAAVAQNSAGYCDVAIDATHDGLTVWWHGTATPAVLAVLDRARSARITPSVLPAPFDRLALMAVVSDLEPRMTQLGVTALSVSADCSAIDIGLASSTPAAQAKVRVGVPAWVPLRFRHMDPVVPLGWRVPASPS